MYSGSHSVATSMTTLPTPAHSVNGSSNSQGPDMMDDLSPQKRKRTMDDDGDRQKKKQHSEESKVGIEALHLDVGVKYLVCRTRKAPFLTLPPIPAALPCTLMSRPRLRAWRMLPPSVSAVEVF